MGDPTWAGQTGAEPDWYADPHGGEGVRWWDGDRWTDDVRDAHPSGRAAESLPPAADPGPGGAGGLGDDPSPLLVLPRLHVQQNRVRVAHEPRYAVGDPWGRPAGVVWERPYLDGRTQRSWAATLDGMDFDGEGVFRITCDPHVVGPALHALGWPIPPEREWVVFDGTGAPAARATGGHGSWLLHVVGMASPLGIADQQIGARRAAPRRVMLDGQVLATITLTSGWNAADAYVVDVPGAPYPGPLGVTLAAVGVLYDQIFREVARARPSSGLSGSSD